MNGDNSSTYGRANDDSFSSRDSPRSRVHAQRVDTWPAASSSADTRGSIYQQKSISGGRVHFGDVYSSHNYFSSSLSAEILAKGQLNDRNSKHVYIVPRSSANYFVGRRVQLQHLNFYLGPVTASGCIRKVVVVHGLGGSGKTQFCLKYAELKQESYWGIFWIDASSQGTSDNGYANLGALFGKGSTAAAGRYWLSQIDLPWLLVLDNAGDPGSDLSSILPTGKTGHVIITTRNPNLTTYASAGTIHLTGMDPDEAIDLLLNSAYPEDAESRMQVRQRSIAQQIAERLGYLAIALHQAGATVRRKIYTLEKYLRSYLGHRNRLMSALSSSFEEQADIIATWEIPFQRIEATNNNSYRDAAALLHLFAFFHHESIPETIFASIRSGSISIQDSGFTVPGILSCHMKDEEYAHARLREALSILYDYSIIEFDSSNGVCLHPVVHQWARSRIRDVENIRYWLRCTAFILSCSGIQLDSDRIEASTSLLLPHVDTYLQLVDDFDPQILETQWGASQLEHISRIYEAAGLWRSSLKILKKVEAYRVTSQGQRHEDTLRVKRNASLCHWNLFEVQEAVELQRQIRWARWISRPSTMAWYYLIRPTHIEYLVTLSDLTQTLWLAGQRDLSKKAGERALNGLSRKLGADHPLTLDATFHLGRTYRHLGRTVEAHQLLTLVLRKRKQSLGINHLDTLMAKNEVGMSLCARKTRLNVAEKLVKQVLEARTRILGEEHAYTLWSVNDLAKVFSTRGRPEQAIEILKHAIPAVIRTLGDKHVGMQMTKGNLARAYSQCRQLEEAKRTLDEIIPNMNTNHPDWIMSMIGCSRIHIRLGEFDEAEKKCQVLLSRLQESDDNRPVQRYVVLPQVATWQYWMAVWAKWYLGMASSTAQDSVRAVSGLLAEIYKRRGNQKQLDELRIKYPDLDEHIMDRVFELI